MQPNVKCECIMHASIWLGSSSTLLLPSLHAPVPFDVGAGLHLLQEGLLDWHLAAVRIAVWMALPPLVRWVNHPMHVRPARLRTYFQATSQPVSKPMRPQTSVQAQKVTRSW